MSRLCKIEEKLEGIVRVAWFQDFGTQGANYNAWTGNAAPHGQISGIFNTGVGQWGLQGHVNGAPDITSTTPDLNFTDTELIGAGNGLEQLEVWGYLVVDQAGFIRDNNGNTGETAQVWLGQGGCCNDSFTLISEQVTSTNGADRVVLDPYAIEPGIYPFLVRTSDLSAAQGFDLEFATALGGPWANMTQSYTELPTWCPKVVPCDYELEEGETWEPPKPCCSDPVPVYPPSTPVLPALALPIADNEDDNSLRTGQVGASLLYAREDHNHPINRLDNPGYQTFTVNGPATLNATVNYGFWSTEESVFHRYRLQILVDAGNGWVWFNVPTIPGFQRPIITTLTTYRYSNSNQQADGNQALGNSPDGPVMGQEAAEWTNIPRVYLNSFNHPTAANYYVHLVTQNIKL